MPANRKITALVIFGILIAILAIFLPEQEDIAFEVVVNNTELCQYNHTLGRCTGERNTSTLYWANDSAIQIFLMAHANTVGSNASVQLYINGTQVEHTSGRPLGAAEDSYKSISAIIPKSSNYSATFQNYHHYEWREYPIISGRNGTISINQTVIQQGAGSQNLSQVLQQGNSAGTSNINMSGNDILNPDLISKSIGNNQVYTFYDAVTPVIRSKSSNVSTSNYIEQFVDYTAFSKRISVDGSIAMNGNLTGCTNCDANLATKVNKTGDNMTGILGTNNKILMTPDYLNHMPSVYEFEFTRNNSAFFGIASYATLASQGVYFVSQTGKGNTTNPLPLVRDQLMFTFVSTGYKTNTTVSGTTARYSVWADGDWNSTSTPTRIMFTVVANGSTATTDALIIKNDSSLTASNLAVSGTGNYSLLISDSTGKIIAIPMNGSGNHYVCANGAGLPYPGTPGC